MKQQDPDADDNCLLAVAKEQLKFGHARKPSNSRFVVPRHTEISYTVIESLSFMLRISQNSKWTDKNSSKQFLWKKIAWNF